VATDAFIELFRLEATQRGLPDLPVVVVPHPIGGLKSDAVRVKATPIVDEMLAKLSMPA
jgi:hypothetical protein